MWRNLEMMGRASYVCLLANGTVHAAATPTVGGQGRRPLAAVEDVCVCGAKQA